MHRIHAHVGNVFFLFLKFWGSPKGEGGVLTPKTPHPPPGSALETHDSGSSSKLLLNHLHNTPCLCLSKVGPIPHIGLSLHSDLMHTSDMLRHQNDTSMTPERSLPSHPPHHPHHLCACPILGKHGLQSGHNLTPHLSVTISTQVAPREHTPPRGGEAN